jgi:hypothetical protein
MPPCFEKAPDVATAVKWYLEQFVHLGCGGAPIAYTGPAADQLECTVCHRRWPANGPLGAAVEKAGEFIMRSCAAPDATAHPEPPKNGLLFDLE